MNDLEFKKMWDTYNNQLSESLSINRELLSEVKKTKVNKLLSSIRPIRIFAIIIGIIWVIFVDFIIVLAFLAGNYFLFFSAGIHSLVTKIAIGVSIYHLILIHQINRSDSVVSVQKKIAKFRLSTLTSVRLSLLQLPVFTTFYINESMIANAGVGFWIIQSAITLLFAFAGIWCYRNIDMKNSDKKWFKFLFGDKEWKSLAKAEDMLQQIADLEEK